jgi:hypothetical protein
MQNEDYQWLIKNIIDNLRFTIYKVQNYQFPDNLVFK